MEYLREFANHNAYDAAKSSLSLPNVSTCIQEHDVHYNPWTWAEEYLTFVALEDGTFTFTPQNNNVISCSTDNGNTWTEGNSVEVTNGDKVIWKGKRSNNLVASPQIFSLWVVDIFIPFYDTTNINIVTNRIDATI